MAFDLTQIFNDINHLKIAVIGDIMLDTYWWGNVDRISPEGPVPVVAVTKKELRIGGAANVALNAKAMGSSVSVLSVIGDDEEGKQLVRLLQERDISVDDIIASNKRVTTNKIRIIGRNQQMMRLDAEIQNDLDEEDESLFVKTIKNFIEREKPDVIILEDYNKGVLTAHVISKVITLANESHIITAVDPKRRNFFSYKNVTLFKPNFKEVKESLNILSSEISVRSMSAIHQQLHEKLNHDISLITLSEHGIFYQQKDDAAILDSHIRNIADVSGAGDTVIAVAALLFAVTKNVFLTAED
jgi:rfaE bifunctional protein kinase chain/domain